jgi:hypothetical protein
MVDEGQGTDGTGEQDGGQDSGWDKEKQYQDELKASFRREAEAQARLEQAQAQLEQMSHSHDSDDSQGLADDADYDQVVRTVKTLQKSLNEVKQTNQQLNEKLQKVTSSHNADQGTRKIQEISATQEKRFGRKDLTNAVLESVNERYEQNGIVQWPDEQRAAWIAQEIELEFARQHEAKPKKSQPSADVTVDGGGGNQAPPTVVPEGTMDEVAEAMQKKYADST